MKKVSMLSTLMLAFTMAVVFTSCQKDNSAKDDVTETASAEVQDPAASGADQTIPPLDPNLPVTSIEWEKKLHDFGDIPKGEKQTYTFKFKNTGDNPLVIASATAGCGCTVPKKPEEPIPPGKTGEISVEYNGSGNGKISKNVTVVLNTEQGTDILNISANVLGE